MKKLYFFVILIIIVVIGCGNPAGSNGNQNQDNPPDYGTYGGAGIPQAAIDAGHVFYVVFDTATSSWDELYSEKSYNKEDLQTAINDAATASGDGNQRYVAIQLGTYTHTDSFSLKNRVTIIGGFIRKRNKWNANIWIWCG